MLVFKNFRFCFHVLLLFVFLIFLQFHHAFSEGTKQLAPTQADELKGNLQIFDNNTITRPFMSYAADSTSRLYIHVCNLGEIIYLGFKQTDNDVYFRLKDPDGNIVIDTTKIPNTNGMPGYINSYGEAVAGPRQIVGASGYLAIQYTPLKTGDYYIETNPKQSGKKADVLYIQKRVFTYFDITVANGNTIYLGRLWSRQWDINCNSAANQFKCTMFIYSNDGIVTSIDFNGIQPFGFTIACNSSGVKNTSAGFTDRQSVSGNVNYPSYKIFLNNPDLSCYPTGVFGGLTGNITISGCDPNNRCINIPVDKAGNANIILDLNGIAGYQPGTADRLLSTILKVGDNCVPWDSRDGLGNPVATGTNLPIQLDYFNGITHLPLFDVENHPNGFKVSLVRPVGPVPKLFWDDSKISGGTTNLTGCSSGAGCHSWSGTKAPDGTTAATNWGDARTINTWWYANIITANVSFNVAGNISVDANTLNPPSVTTNDTTICDNTPTFKLSGAFTTATGAIWSGGSGTFAPDRNDLQAVYTPSALEKTAGKILLKLTSTGNGACPPVSDSMIIFIKPGPKVVAGVGPTVCENNAQITLNGTVAVATGGKWTGGGNGIFTPDANKLKAVYTASDSIKKSGKVILTLTSTGNGTCPAASDQVTITYTAAPTVNAGKDTTMCANNFPIPLNGTITQASGGTWSGGAGSYTMGNTNLKTFYNPSASEIAAGKVTLTLTSNAFGNCAVEKDEIVLNITAIPIVDAGSDMSVCSNNAVVNLKGIVKNAKGGLWSGGKGNYNPKPDSLTTIYTLTPAEITAAKVVLYLTSTGNKNCLAVKDSLTILVTPQPSTSAGPDKTVCANNSATNLGGSFSGATSITWSGALGATGTFVPNANTPTATYTPSADEIAGALVALIITTNGNGACKAVKDTMLILVSPAPVVNAGADRNICKNNPAITLSGTATNASTQSWSGGLGSFKPNANTLTAVYQPAAAEITQGFVTLTLTATKSNCINVADNVKFTFTSSPIVSAGADQSLCSNNADVKLNGTFSTSTGLTWSGGAGSFSPNATTPNAIYKPTPSEITSGQIQLKAITSGNGNCNAVADSMIVKFTPSPKVNAGIDQTVCSNNAIDTLKGTVSIAAGGTWSGGAGTYTPNASTLNAKYKPSPGEITSGSVSLTLTSTGNGNCLAVTDVVKISFSPAPTSNPGTAPTICADNPVASLNGAVTVAKGGIWSGGNGKYTPDAQTLNAKYQPSATEIQAGKATLILTTTNNGWCTAVAKTMVITIKSAPVVNAGSDQTICGAANSVTLNGKVTNATGGTWTSNGTGTFSPNTLAGSYKPSAADKLTKKVILTLSSTGNGTCLPQTDEIIVNFTPVPTINAGPDQIACTNNLPIKLKGTGSPAKWSGNNGGIFAPDANTLNAEYTPSATEISAGKIVLTLTTNDPSTACPQLADQITISIPAGPKANAGLDQSVCGSLSTLDLNGNVNAAATGGGIWKTTGTGSFTGAPTNLKAKYTISSDDRKIGSVSFTLYTIGNLPCSADSDVVVMQLSPAISVDAGPDKTLCADITAIPLNGSAIIASGGSWKTSGTGIFSPGPNQLSTSYIPSQADTSAKKITLILTSSGNGLCPEVSDQAIITFTPAPIVNAGSDLTICADSSYIQLKGSVKTATGGIWTSDGKGTFSPNAFVLNPSYYVDPSDIIKGKVTLTLTSDGNGTCNAQNKQITLNINAAPTANAGINQTICADANSVVLNGKITSASGGLWKSSGSGTFLPAPNIISSTYQPSSADKKAGLVSLIITSTGNGLCRAVSSQTLITINPAPVVNAGLDKSICADVSGVPLLGTIQNASGGVWSSNGTGTFTAATSLNTIYNPSANDITLGKVSVFLTSSGNGTCTPVIDTMLITIKPIPVITAGSDQTICGDSNSIKLSGNVINAGGGIWTTSGDGNFYPNASSTICNYVPSLSDIAKGKISLVLTSTSNGICTAISDTILLSITPAPSADAGKDEVVCSTINALPILGKVFVAGGARWSTSGTGKFIPDSLQLNANYIPSIADKAVGKVNLTLTTINNGNCKAAKANKNIQITSAPEANAGPDQKICADFNSISLSGKVKQASGGKWTSNGTGVFSPDGNQLTTTYNLSTSDKSSGKVIVVLSTTGAGVCNAVSDTLLLSIEPVPVVLAGTDQTICADATGAVLNGMVSIASGGLWTSSGSGKFSPNPNTLKATYLPSASDKMTGKVALKLTSTGNGTCQPVSAQVTLLITPAPTIDAGVDQSVCADFEGATIAASKSNAQGVLWKSSGTGVFSPDATSIQAVYIASSTDISAGSVTLSVVTTGNGLCKAVSDQMILAISKKPTIDAGPDIMVCPDATNLQLNASITGALGGVWSTTGSGSFNSNNNVTSSLLNDTYHPSAADVAAGNITLQLVTTGNGSCNFLTDELIISFSGVPQIEAGPNRTICSTSLPIMLEGSGTTGNWSGGNGTYSPSNSSLNAAYVPNAGELAAKKVKLYLTSTSSGTCSPTKDSVEFAIIDGPVSEADVDQTICANLPKAFLNGQVKVATGGTWTTSGNGIFQSTGTNSTPMLEDTYAPSLEEINAGIARLTLTTTGNLSCRENKDDMFIHISPAPLVNAGEDETICADLTTIGLNGSFSNAGGIKWTRDGFGTIGNDANLSTNYSLDQADTTAGFVRFILSTTGNGNCLAMSDTMIVSITPLPVANPGVDQIVCADEKEISLEGKIYNAGGAIWSSSGNGTFTPSNNGLISKYIPTAADTAAKSIQLTLTASGKGTCIATSKSFKLTFTPLPIVNAGEEMTICADSKNIILNGQVDNASGGIWSTSGTGLFTPNKTDSKANYKLTDDDVRKGGITLSYTSQGSLVCNNVSDYLSITILPPPIAAVNAGQDQIVCADAEGVILNGNVKIASGGQWSTSGNGKFYPDASNLNAVYQLSSSDISTGSVNLILTTVGNGLCSPVSDTMHVTILPAPILNPGNNITVCADTIGIKLNGKVSNALGGSWTTTGSGFFSPSADQLNATYVPSSSDLQAAKVGLTLLSTGNGSCKAISSGIVLNITKQPTVEAGIDQTICVGTEAAQLNGIKTIAKGVLWSSSGTGNFVPDELTANASYVPSSEDKINGAVSLRIVTTINGSCKPVNDVMQITILPDPSVNAGTDITICEDSAMISLNAIVKNATGVQWVTTGSGAFASNANSITSEYQPSGSDIKSGKTSIVAISTGSGSCAPAHDTLVLMILPAPKAYIDSLKLCTLEDGVALKGIVSNAGGGKWSSSGTGIFSPNEFTLNAVYFPSVSDTQNGSVDFTLTTTSNGICKATSGKTNLQLIPPAVANAGLDEFVCRNSAITLVAKPVADAVSQWKLAGSAIKSNSSELTTIVQTTSNYVLELTHKNGCISTDTVTVEAIDPPQFHLSDHYCYSDSLIVYSSPTALPPFNGQFQWYRNKQTLSGEDRTIIVPTSDGKFTIEYSYGKCSADSSTFITNPPFLITPDVTGCIGRTLKLSTTFEKPAIYAWSWNGKNIADSVIVLKDTNAYSVSVTENAYGCMSIDLLKIVGLEIPKIKLTDHTICTGDSIFLVATPGNAYPQGFTALYTWKKDGIDINNPNDSLIAFDKGNYTVKVVVSGCDTSVSSKLELNPIPAKVIERMKEFCSNTDPAVVLEASIGADLKYLWELSKDTTRTILTNVEGVYYVQMRNSFNCLLRDSIVVKEICPPVVYTPTGFIPGSDKDGTFQIFGKDFTNFQIVVFNRWGEIIFMSNNKNVSWDGTYRGQPMPMGSYPYLITYNGVAKGHTGPQKIEGQITIIR